MVDVVRTITSAQFLAALAPRHALAPVQWGITTMLYQAHPRLLRASALAEWIWPAGVPDYALNSIHTVICRLRRRRLPIRRQGQTYGLAIRPDASSSGRSVVLHTA